MNRIEKPLRTLTASSVSEDSSYSHQSSSEAGYSVLGYDILTVFQAAPLAYKDGNTGNMCPIGMLDFDLEREILTEALNEARTVDAKIDVNFETGTVDRLGAFLAKGESQILHFSCHGHPDYLFIENGWGAGQCLPVQDLKEWIVAGGSSLQFVFVSACHSRSAGEAFLEAGVPHVVCCQQDSQQVRNSAAVEFARAFYRALACKRSLKDAFELGRHGVLLCPHVEDAKNEMNKFVLLPEGGNHNVSIFFDKPLPSKFATKSWCRRSRSRMFPVPPQPFVGRDVDMFRLIDAVRTSRIVRLTGERGTGKCSLVTSVVQYMYRRNLMNDVFWLPTDHKRNGNDNNIASWLSRLFDQFQNDERRALTFRYDKNYKAYRDEILDELHEMKAVIVFDTRSIVLTDGLKKLITFLEDLLHGTINTRVIVIHRINEQIHSRNFSCVEADIELAPLSFEDTVALFCCLCRRVSDPDDLKHLLISWYAANPIALRHRSAEVFKMLGEGNPAKINSAAKNMTAVDYEKLVGIAKRPAPVSFNTRAALEAKLTTLQEELAAKVWSMDFLGAQNIQESLDEMEVQREALPDLATLRMMADGIKADQEQAIFMKSFGTAAELQKELDSLNAQIVLEEKDSPPQQPPRNDIADPVDEKCPPVLLGTRTSLEAEMRKLEAALEEACDKNDFREARRIDEKLGHLKLRIEKLPSVEQLSTKLGQFKVELKEAKNDRRWENAEILHHKIVDLENKLTQERNAEQFIHNEAATNVAAIQTQSKPTSGHQTAVPEVRSRDPPGIYASSENEEPPKAPESLSSEQPSSAGVPMFLSRAATRVRPGAFAISGEDVARRRKGDVVADEEPPNVGPSAPPPAAILPNEVLSDDGPGSEKVISEVQNNQEHRSNEDTSQVSEDKPVADDTQGLATQILLDGEDSQYDIASSSHESLGPTYYRCPKDPRRGSKAYALVVVKGSILDYASSFEKSGIVCPTDETCSFAQGSLIGAIGDTGGIQLQNDVYELSAVGENEDRVIRCQCGEARILGPKPYGDLKVPYVILAVGPIYGVAGVGKGTDEERDEQLRDAYLASLRCAAVAGLESVAFSLISAGTRAGGDVLRPLRVAVETLSQYGGYKELKEIRLYGYLQREADGLNAFARELELEEVDGVTAVYAEIHSEGVDERDLPKNQTRNELENQQTQVVPKQSRKYGEGIPHVAQSNLNQQYLIFDSTGVVLAGKEADKHCKRKGLCRRCGKVPTHKRKRRGLRFKMEPLTLTDESGNYSVYKGYHMGEHCYSLDQAKRELGEESESKPSRFGRSRREKIGTVARIPPAAQHANEAGPSHKRPNTIARIPLADEDLPVATVVPAAEVAGYRFPSDEGANRLDTNWSRETDEERIDRMIREKLSAMAVTATSVEKISTDEQDDAKKKSPNVHSEKTPAKDESKKKPAKE